jgi:hypothetical protein
VFEVSWDKGEQEPRGMEMLFCDHKFRSCTGLWDFAESQQESEVSNYQCAVWLIAIQRRGIILILPGQVRDYRSRLEELIKVDFLLGNMKNRAENEICGIAWIVA